MPKVVTRTESSAVVRQESTTRRVVSDNPRIARVVAAGGQGPRGIQGMSSYEVWLAAGNSGTVDDFMEAIRGPIGTVTAEDVRNAVGYVPEVSGAAASAQAAAIASARAYTDGEVDSLKAGVPIEGDTLSKLHTRISALQLLLTSDDVSLDSLQEVVTFVKEHEYDLTLLGMSKVNVADIINDLITPAPDRPLAAAQGKILKELVDTLSANLQSLANAADPFPQYATTAEAAAAAPVQSVAGRTGAVVLTKEDVGLPYADNTPDTDKPVSTAQAAAISTAQAAAIAAAQSDVDTKISALKGAVPSDGDTLAKLRSLIGGLQAILASDDVNLDSLQEVVSFIKDHESDLALLSGSKVNVADIVNLLTSSAVDKPLSAAQGKALKDLLDALTAVVATKEPAIAPGAATQYFRGDKIWRTLATDVRAVALAGLSTASSALLSVNDTVLSAFGKLQAQITSLLSSLNAHAALSNPHGTTATDVGADPVGAAAAAQASAILAAAADATAKIDALKGGVGTDGDTLAKLRGLITNIQTLLTSDDVSLDTIQEIVTFVKDHEGDLALLGTSKVNISDIVNTLSDTSINKPLAAAQGKALNDMLDALTTVVSGKEPSIAGGSTSQYWRGDKVWRDFAADVRATLLTGLNTSTAAPVSATDTALVGIGKLQAQVTDEVSQADAEGGISTSIKAWSSLRVRQAWTAAWIATANIDGKNIGATTAGTGRFTTLNTTGNVTLGDSTADSHVINGILSMSHNVVGGAVIAIARSPVVTVGASTTGVTATIKTSTEASVTGYEIAGNFVVYPSVKAGLTQAGYSRASDMSALRNIIDVGYDDAGTLSALQGLGIAVGHYNTRAGATPVTSTIYGVNITPYIMTGSCGSFFGINVNALTGTPANVAAASALRLGFAGTVTAHRNIDAWGTAYNYLLGNTGIGQQPVDTAKLAVSGNMVIAAASTADALRINQTGTGNALVVEDTTSPDSSPVVINAAGQVVVGATTARNIGVSPALIVEGLGSSSSTAAIVRNSADTSPATLRGVKSRGTTSGAVDAVGSSDNLWQLIAYGTDGTAEVQAAAVTFSADGAVSTGVVPGKITLSTTATGAGSPTARLAIGSSGHLTPGANKTQDFGSLTLQWSGIYAGSVYADTAITEAGRSVLVDSDIGTDDNQVPLNAYLGGLAYMSPERLVIKPQASVTPAAPGDMVFELTNDTTLTVRARGSDGVVRSTSWTLS